MRHHKNSITQENLNDIRTDIRTLKKQIDWLENRVGGVGQATLGLFNPLEQRILNLEKLIKTNNSTDSEARNNIIELTEYNVRMFDSMNKRILKLEEFINIHPKSQPSSQPRSPSLYHNRVVIPQTSSSSDGSMKKGIYIKKTHRKKTHRKRTNRKRNSRKRPHKNR